MGKIFTRLLTQFSPEKNKEIKKSEDNEFSRKKNEEIKKSEDVEISPKKIEEIKKPEEKKGAEISLRTGIRKNYKMEKIISHDSHSKTLKGISIHDPS